MMFFDLHTHTFHSDGVLSPLELINRAAVNGYAAIAITDHVALGSLERLIRELSEDCALASKYWSINAIPGVELTHLPPDSIDNVAEAAHKLGALLIIVHGETTQEPVPRGTNLAALNSPFVDILAHPGLITRDEANLAARNSKYLELSARRGHSNTNAHIASMAILAGAKLLVNSDAHNENELLTPETAGEVLRSANVGHLYDEILVQNPQTLMQLIVKRRDKSVRH
jgi:histidinol phosphatase-like PHP family hydrolase